MNRLPKPDWLSLQATLDWTAEQTAVALEEVATGLAAVFRDGKVFTRGRCRSYFEHDTQMDLNRIDWDQATVDWEGSGFSVPGDRGRQHVFSDVEVNREDLEDWLRHSENPAPEASNDGDAQPDPPKKMPASQRGRKDEFRWEDLHDLVACSLHERGWPRTKEALTNRAARLYELAFDETPPSRTQLQTRLINRLWRWKEGYPQGCSTLIT